MSDDDLIRRGDALKLMQLAIDVYGQNMRGAADKKEKRDWQSMLIAAVDIRYAIKDIPAAQVTVTPNDPAKVQALAVAMDALKKIADTDPDEGTGWFHDVANAALKGDTHE